MLSTGVKVTGNNICRRFNVYFVINKSLTPLFKYIYHYLRNPAIGHNNEIPGKFRNVVLEKDGEDQLDRSCEK